MPTPIQIRLIANAANQAGQRAEAFSYMAEFYLSMGNFQEAIEQLKNCTYNEAHYKYSEIKIHCKIE